MLKSIVIEKSFIIRLKRRLKIEAFKTKIHKKKKKKRKPWALNSSEMVIAAQQVCCRGNNQEIKEKNRCAIHQILQVKFIYVDLSLCSFIENKLIFLQSSL